MASALQPNTVMLASSTKPHARGTIVFEIRKTSIGRRARAFAPQRGFTLIETMMVFLLIGIFLVVATPAFNTYRAHLVRKQACGQLIDDLRAARQMAVTQRTRVVVQFGNGTATANISNYQVHCDKNNDGVIQSSELVMKSTLPKKTLLSQVSLVPKDTVIFDISGLLRPGTSGGRLIVKSNKDVDTLQVSVAGMVYHP